MIWARRFADGLLGKARALFHGLGPKGEYPSRGHYLDCRHWQHKRCNCAKLERGRK